jgi:hypothetical protein
MLPILVKKTFHQPAFDFKDRGIRLSAYSHNTGTPARKFASLLIILFNLNRRKAYPFCPARLAVRGGPAQILKIPP